MGARWDKVLTNRRLLVVDDDASIRDALSVLLDGSGCRLSAVGSSEEALEVLRTESFDLFLVDHKLNGLDGLELIRKLAGLRPRAWIVFTTAQGSKRLFEQARSAGAGACIDKPLTMEKLIVAFEGEGAVK